MIYFGRLVEKTEPIVGKQRAGVADRLRKIVPSTVFGLHSLTHQGSSHSTTNMATGSTGLHAIVIRLRPVHKTTYILPSRRGISVARSLSILMCQHSLERISGQAAVPSRLARHWCLTGIGVQQLGHTSTSSRLVLRRF